MLIAYACLGVLLFALTLTILRKLNVVDFFKSYPTSSHFVPQTKKYVRDEHPKRTPKSGKIVDLFAAVASPLRRSEASEAVSTRRGLNPKSRSKTTENFGGNDLWISGGPYKFTDRKVVGFFSKDCGHCRRMIPEWTKFMNTAQMQVQSVYADQAPALITEANIKSFPTIRKFRLNSQGEILGSDDYVGTRSAPALLAWAQEKM